MALSHLRDGRRTNVGAGRLARASSGFATALQADPRARVARHNLDLMVRSFLGRAAYLLMLVAFATAELFGRSATTLSRVAPVVLLAVPLGFVAVMCGCSPRKFVATCDVPLWSPVRTCASPPSSSPPSG